MARKQTALFAAAMGIVALAFAAGCGGDDTTDPGVTPDGGKDVSVPPTPPPTPPPPNPPPPPPRDGGPDADAGCDFNAFVTGLITDHTNAKDLPSTDLGDTCVDTRTPFPQTLF